jgi:radical SAM superfamily enzyme YgiQ (UPF0313 family)
VEAVRAGSGRGSGLTRLFIRQVPRYPPTPVLLWELVNFKHYSMISIQFLRGCLFNCIFCNITTLLGHYPRTKTAAQITAKLDGIANIRQVCGLELITSR